MKDLRQPKYAMLFPIDLLAIKYFIGLKVERNYFEKA